MRVSVELLDQQFQMFGSRPAASSDNGNVVFGHELIQVVRKRFRLEGIDRLSIHVERKTGVGDARDREYGVFAKDTDGLAHVFGTRGTVQTDHGDAHTLEDR